MGFFVLVRPVCQSGQGLDRPKGTTTGMLVLRGAYYGAQWDGPASLAVYLAGDCWHGTPTRAWYFCPWLGWRRTQALGVVPLAVTIPAPNKA